MINIYIITILSLYNVIFSQEFKIVKEKLNDNLYILKASNYNTHIGLLISTKGVVLIDPVVQYKNYKDLLNIIKGISTKPIKYVINTHSHADHSGANRFYANLGATIISQENVRYSPAFYQETFKKYYRLELGNEVVEMHHFISHTFDDVIIHLHKNNTIFMGDNYMNNWYPHSFSGGIKGHQRILNKAISLSNNKTHIIPGHGKQFINNKNELKLYKKNITEFASKVFALYEVDLGYDDIYNSKDLTRIRKELNINERSGASLGKRMITRLVSSNLINSLKLSEKELLIYTGNYYIDGNLDELVLINSKLFIRRKAAYIFEIIPISKTHFRIRGHSPYKSLRFGLDKKGEVKTLIYSDSEKELIGLKKMEGR